jgi:hypothetical protein
MSDAGGNGHPYGLEAFELRVRRLEMVIDDRDAKLLFEVSKLRGDFRDLGDRLAELNAHVMDALKGLSDRIPKPSRRKPKRGRRK